jgi:hypothetical protein
MDFWLSGPLLRLLATIQPESASEFRSTNKPGAWTVKIFTVVIHPLQQLASVFVTPRHFHFSLIFAGKTMSEPLLWSPVFSL